VWARGSGWILAETATTPGDILERTGDTAVTLEVREARWRNADPAHRQRSARARRRRSGHRTGLPVAFGGFERANAVEVTSVVGNRTPHLSGLVVHASRGLGGRALVERRPRLALDYRSSRNITHDYDRAILGEGISTLFAVPVLVAGRARGVLYCGSWSPSPSESPPHAWRSRSPAIWRRLRVREEVQRRLTLAPASTSGVDPVLREHLRDTYAQLRRIAADVPDAAIRRRLAEIEQRLADLTREDGAATERST
jgi:hypothetical protein